LGSLEGLATTSIHKIDGSRNGSDKNGKEEQAAEESDKRIGSIVFLGLLLNGHESHSLLLFVGLQVSVGAPFWQGTVTILGFSIFVDSFNGGNSWGSNGRRCFLPRFAFGMFFDCWQAFVHDFFLVLVKAFFEDFFFHGTRAGRVAIVRASVVI
jgi:hypothetical protein